MSIDIRTLAIAASALSVLQIVMLGFQYATNRKSRGIGYWLLWSLFVAAGIIVLFSENLVPENFGASVSFLGNLVLLGGFGFLYAGIHRFFNRRIPWVRLAVFFSVFLGIYLSRRYAQGEDFRQVALYASGFLFSLGIVQILYRNSSKSIQGATVFLAVVFSLQGLVYFFGAAHGLTAVLPDSGLYRNGMDVAVTLLTQVCGVLLSFGLISMMYQRSNAEHIEAQTNMQLVFDTHPDAVWITCLADEKIADVNDGFTSLTGMSRQDAVGRNSLELGLWKNPEDRRRILETVRDRGAVEDREIEFKFRNGRQCIGILSSRFFSLHGLPHLINVIHDITERKRMEVSLRESEEKFRLLVENSNDIIYTLSSTGIVEFVSPVCKALLGHDVAEIQGKSIGDFVHPDDMLSFFSFFNSVMATGNSGAEIEYRMRHKNGSWVWHSSSGVPFRDESGMILGFYGISRDVSEQKRLEDELHLQATTDELTRTHNRRDFISIATLEIRRALRLSHPLSLALIDLDEFKLMNDTWGHAAGDRALVLFAEICQENIREIDILSRVGGDEFTVLMPETGIDQAYEILSRVRKSVAGARFRVDDHDASITVSIGVTILRGADDHLDCLLSRADRALYRSKTGGRNAVSLER